MTTASNCFHCGEPLPENPPLAILGDEEKPVCCIGCKAVAELIHSSGLSNFYELREGASIKPADHLPTAASKEWLVFDRQEVQKEFVEQEADGDCEASLLIEGVHCAACSWLIKNSLAPLSGVDEVQVNPATTRASIRWDPNKINLSQLLHRIAQLGYRPHPGQTTQAEKIRLKEKRAAILRLGLAGMGMMQVMTFAISLYTGIFEGMDAHTRTYFRYVSLFLTTPVLFYSGLPFLQGAWRDIKNRHAGMDVPVAIALLLAYFSSVWVTLNQGEHVYFDSVVMFVFFLLVARQVELNVRHAAGSTADALSQLTPASAIRMIGEKQEIVGIQELSAGDIVLARDGDAIPADGKITQGSTWVDESLITGESKPQFKKPGDLLIAGSSVHGDSVNFQVEKTGKDTVLSTISRLLDKAQMQRPPVAKLADKVAGWFVLFILLLATIVGLTWWMIEPVRAFAITLSVLVVTCPCALSLATPVSLAAATSRMTKNGLLVANGEALESLPKLDCVVFDKTGTLTTGQLKLVNTYTTGDISEQQVIQLAALLEQKSSHPIALALQTYLKEALPVEVKSLPGKGLEASWQGHRYRIGRADFAFEHCPNPPEMPQSAVQGTIIALSREDQAMGWLEFQDEIREDTAQVLKYLKTQNIETIILSGDQEAAVKHVAAKLGISNYVSDQLPEDKLRYIETLQKAGRAVCMIGDGVNDAPVLAASNVSIAMGQGAAVAQSTSDLILMTQSLKPLTEGLKLARKTQSIIRQNLSWAISYNLTAIPLAAVGWIQPWMAALGMSFSSLFVVLNALRLSRAPNKLKAQ